MTIMMDQGPNPGQGAPARGLCATCAHARLITSDRGRRFTQCAKSATDDRFEKYPRLPVVRCPGYEAAESAGSAAIE